MQTLTVQVEDNYIQNFMNYVNNHSENITILKDKNLESDSFFYERKKELHQIRDDIKSGKSQLISFDDFENNTTQLEKELELKYAN
ncbi:hypothetical protein [Sulfurimonas sp.]|jgi:hypothetical protein|uniref:hypothetical protein n=1 Tax=Sulfurimonas sp. TaxID=2022749 RepID=UPI0025E6402F|nr:hypothetical protein [Sulfurimonas sp.]MBT5934064.1 hypothetical protein [Sulfurimonas sp.]